MNWDTLKGKWQQFAGQMKSKWGKLQERYGHNKDQAEKEVDDFIAGL